MLKGNIVPDLPPLLHRAVGNTNFLFSEESVRVQTPHFNVAKQYLPSSFFFTLQN